LATRREHAILLRQSGMAQVEIGRLLGVSGERVRQIIRGKNNRKVEPFLADLPLSTGDVARMLNIHTNTVRRWCRSGILKAYRVGPRGDRRFDRSEVIKLLQKSEF
jgi:excisionase family DNA binding protein